MVRDPQLLQNHCISHLLFQLLAAVFDVDAAATAEHSRQIVQQTAPQLSNSDGMHDERISCLNLETLERPGRLQWTLSMQQGTEPRRVCERRFPVGAGKVAAGCL